MAKKLFILLLMFILLLIMLCALCIECDGNSKTVVKCANCGVEIELHSETGALITETLGGDNGVLCSDCSRVEP